MKRIYKLLSICTLLLVLSCNKDDSNSVFGKTLDQRAQEKNNAFQTLLESSEHGWVGSYQADSTLTGVWQVLLKFNEDGTVKTYSDMPLAHHTSTGEFSKKEGGYKETLTPYRIDNEFSVDLIFEGDMIFHYIASINKFGVKGEFDFYYDSENSTEDEIVLVSKTDTGEQTQLILTKATANSFTEITNRYDFFKSITDGKLLSGRKFVNNELKTASIFNWNEARSIENGLNIKDIEEVNGFYDLTLIDSAGNESVYSEYESNFGLEYTLPLNGDGTVELPEFKLKKNDEILDTSNLIVEPTTIDTSSVGVKDLITVKNKEGESLINVLAIVHDPSIVGTDVSGNIMDTVRTTRTGVIRLVEGTTSIFYVSDFGFSGTFPMYFQMNGDQISEIPQTYVFSNAKTVNMTYDSTTNILTSHILPADYSYTFQLTQ